MGLFSNTKDAKKAIFLYETHCCSKCGKRCASKQKVVLQYSYDEIALSRSEAERKTLAGQKLDEAAEKLAARAADPQDIGKYYDLNLLGKCECGHREPWSRMRLRLFDPIFNALIVMSTLALIAGIAQIFTQGSGVMLLPAAGIIFLTVDVWLVKKILIKKREDAIEELDKEYIPFLTEDEAAFREKYPEIDTEKLETVEPSGYYRITD